MIDIQPQSTPHQTLPTAYGLPPTAFEVVRGQISASSIEPGSVASDEERRTNNVLPPPASSLSSSLSLPSVRGLRIEDRAEGQPPASRGFTLTEVLVVITILAILAALGTVGIMRALDTAKQSRIKIELDNIAAALQTYRDTYGSFPPSEITTANIAVVSGHVARAFPRYNLGTNLSNLKADLATAGIDLNSYRPDQALVFWLRGFSPDVTNPFVAWVGNDAYQITGGVKATTKTDVTPLFDFDQTRLQLLVPTGIIDPVASYVPAGVKTNVPYVYLEAASYHFPTPTRDPRPFRPSYAFDRTKNSNMAFAGYAVPYIRDVNGDRAYRASDGDEFINPDSFQLIACGLDGLYADPKNIQGVRIFPECVGPGYTLNDDDNLTNFSEKARLGDARP